jgi:hypothetical protein
LLVLVFLAVVLVVLVVLVVQVLVFLAVVLVLVVLVQLADTKPRSVATFWRVAVHLVNDVILLTGTHKSELQSLPPKIAPLSVSLPGHLKLRFGKVAKKLPTVLCIW